MNESVIVPLAEVAKAFAGAESAIQDAAQAGGDESGALALAAIGKTLRKIHETPSESSTVMETKQNGAISRLQSLIASGEEANIQLLPCPAGGLEAKFDTRDYLGWAKVAWERIRHPKNHDWVKPLPEAEPFPESGRVAMLADWGTGLYGAPVAAETIARDNAPYAMLLHLGDVYYSGTKSETQERFLDLWPSRAEAIKRSTNGNHEMYSGGYGYFDRTLPAFGQKASCFAHQNEHWTLVGLDVAFKDHDIEDNQVDWLEKIIQAAGMKRKIILFSHHQLFSHYETQGSKLWSHERFRAILKSKRIHAWYWGHEHRCCIFDRHAETGILARCIGHGGMPQSRKDTWDLEVAKNVGPHWADWRQKGAATINGMNVPRSLILEGENPFIKGEEKKFLPHGYAVLNFDGPKLVEQVLEPTGKVIYEEKIG